MKANITDWYKIRTKAIHERVTAYDILSKNGITLTGVSGKEEQFSCPFHGKDVKPSARIYPESATGRSGVWCFVCREKGWDAIGLWKKFSGEEKSFHQILSEMERAFGLTTPPVPEGGFESTEVQVDETFDELSTVCEFRLKRARAVYTMNEYLVAGSILDKVYHQVGTKVLSQAKGVEILRELITRIGAKIRGTSNPSPHTADGGDTAPAH